jgi:hypothetical protein
VVNHAVKYGDDPEGLKSAPPCVDNHEESTSMLYGSQTARQIRMRTRTSILTSASKWVHRPAELSLIMRVWGLAL